MCIAHPAIPSSTVPKRGPGGRTRDGRTWGGLRHAARATLFAAALGLAAAAAPTSGAAQGSVDITARIILPGSYSPPPQRVERVPRLKRHQAWIPGHWEWRPGEWRPARPGRGPKHRPKHRHGYGHGPAAGEWVWIPGHVAAARPGYRYVPPRWSRGRHNQWDRHGGVWVRAR